MKGINPSFNLIVFLTVALIFNAFLLPIAEAQQPSANKTDNGQECPWLEDGEFVFPEYSNGVLNAVEVQAINDAERDASAHLNKLLWFTTGFSLPVIGVFLSQRNQRSIPGARLLGKSPEYVAFYTNAYRIKMKKLRFNWSLLGCLGGTAVAGLTVFWGTR